MRTKIINGMIIDGTGSPAYRGDLLMEDDKIVKVGDCRDEEAERVIDAENKIVAPGFIDVHTHSDFSVLYDGSAENRIYNGVTTDVCGNCGVGIAPVSDKYRDAFLAYLKTRIVGNIDADLDFYWKSWKEYADYTDSKDIAVNMVPILAEGAVRICVMGLEQREATPEEMEEMKRLVREAMEAGAVGMSSGLIYLPGAFVKKEEMAELCKVVAEYDGFYTSHIRDEGDKFREALKEAMDVAEASGVRLNISHVKLFGTKNQHHTDEFLGLLEDGRSRGITITCDQYPYNSGMTSLMALLPPWISKDGIPQMCEKLADPDVRKKVIGDIENGIEGWQNLLKVTGGFHMILISTIHNPDNKWMEGWRLDELAAKLGMSEYDLFFKLLIDDNARTLVIVEGMSDEDVEIFAERPEIMVGSDSATLAKSGPLSRGKPHPRGYGTQAHFIHEYVKKRQGISIELAVRKMSALAAEHLHLEKRGYLKEGYYADVIVFDLDEVKDNSTVENPRQDSSGFWFVFVNGQMALENGVQTDVRAGRVLKRWDKKEM